MNVFLLIFLLNVIVFSVVAIKTLYDYIRFLIHLNKIKDELGIPENIKKYINEYGGANLIRQEHKIWEELGKNLSHSTLSKKWGKAEKDYHLLRKMLLIEAILAIMLVIFLFLKSLSI